MLYPETNDHRRTADLSGLWGLRLDPNDEGRSKGFSKGLTAARPIAVPASYNDQLEGARDYLGPVWYETELTPPRGFETERHFLRFESVNYLAEVWLNGSKVGTHEGGHLPFELEVTQLLRAGKNRLAQDQIRSSNFTCSRSSSKSARLQVITVAPTARAVRAINASKCKSRSRRAS